MRFIQVDFDNSLKLLGKEDTPSETSDIETTYRRSGSEDIQLQVFESTATADKYA